MGEGCESRETITLPKAFSDSKSGLGDDSLIRAQSTGAIMEKLGTTSYNISQGPKTPQHYFVSKKRKY